jgi:hypothetical protein
LLFCFSSSTNTPEAILLADGALGTDRESRSPAKAETGAAVPFPEIPHTIGTEASAERVFSAI